MGDHRAFQGSCDAQISILGWAAVLSALVVTAAGFAAERISITIQQNIIKDDKADKLGSCKSPSCDKVHNAFECLGFAVCVYEYMRIKKIAYCPELYRPRNVEDISKSYNLTQEGKKAVSSSQTVGQIFAIADTPDIAISPIGEISLNWANKDTKDTLCARYIYGSPTDDAMGLLRASLELVSLR